MTPADLGERGRAIWEQLKADEMPAHTRALIQEAARLADTLDRLDALLTGRQESWVLALADIASGDVTLVVDKLLAERRQQALAFDKILTSISKLGVASQPKPQDEADPLNDADDELANRRRSRGA